jgi:hypothetical protein
MPATSAGMTAVVWKHSGLLRFARNDARHTTSPSRHISPEFCKDHHPIQSKGAGKAGHASAPAALRAKIQNKQVSHHRFTGHPRSSLRDGLRLYSVLSPAIGLFVTVIGAMGQHRQQLHASVQAPRPHDFVVRGLRIRLMHGHVHRIPHPTFVTIAKRPLIGHGTRGKVPVICPTSQAKRPRHTGTTGKSAARAEKSLSSTIVSCPGRAAASGERMAAFFIPPPRQRGEGRSASADRGGGA